MSKKLESAQNRKFAALPTPVTFYFNLTNEPYKLDNLRVVFFYI